ncbi:hypothetical protein KSS87_013993, partial [Heliosperma pusillum]
MSSNTESKCHCEFRIVLKQAWTPKNPGRRFEACSLYKPNVDGGCAHFKWFDQFQTKWQSDITWQVVADKRAFDNYFVHSRQLTSFLMEEKSKVVAENDALKVKINQLTEECEWAKRNEEQLKRTVKLCYAIVC